MAGAGSLCSCSSAVLIVGLARPIFGISPLQQARRREATHSRLSSALVDVRRFKARAIRYAP
jgi:hypothetical protein